MVARKKYLFTDALGKHRVRIKGKTYPLRDEKGCWHEIDTPEGDRIYWEILRGKRADAKRSWSALIDLHRQSDKWAALSPRYRLDLEPVFAYLIEKRGKSDVALLTQADIYDAMEANRHRVRFANYIATGVSMLCKTAIRRRWRTDNPAIGIEPLATPKSKKQPHIPWTDAAVAKWRAEASPLPLLIFEIGVGSVQRPGDWVGFTWGDYDGETLRLRQNKTDMPLVLPCTARLKQILDTTKDSLGFAPMPNRHILTKLDGSKMVYRYMAELMRNERLRLGLTTYDLHALRYRGVMELALAGCDDDEIASYSGHASKSMIRKYAGEARQIMRARQAQAKRM